MTSSLARLLVPSTRALSSCFSPSIGYVSFYHIVRPRTWQLMVLFFQGYSQIDGNLGTVAAAMKLNGTPNDLIQYAPYFWNR